MFNMVTGETRDPVKVSHGGGSLRSGYNSEGKVVRTRYGDSNHDGNLNRCRHTQSAIDTHNRLTRSLGKNDFANSQTNMTRAGFFKVSERYTSTRESSRHWTNLGGGRNAVKMDGLSGDLNDHARDKGVVMHGAGYNTGDTMGRSWGCPAFTPGDARNILNTLTGGALYYSYVGDNCSSDQSIVDNSLPNWEYTCN